MIARPPHRHCAGCLRATGAPVVRIHRAEWHARCYRRASLTERALAARAEVLDAVRRIIGRRRRRRASDRRGER